MGLWIAPLLPWQRGAFRFHYPSDRMHWTFWLYLPALFV